MLTITKEWFMPIREEQIMKLRSGLISTFLAWTIFVLCMAPQVTRAAFVDLTAGTWLVKGIDTGGTTWNSSTLVFETQSLQGQDFSLSGYFNWVGSGGQFGRENFTGTLFSSQELNLSGFEIVRPSIGLGIANYSATLASGMEIVNGSWNGGGVTPSSNWSATLAPVPLPGAVLLFGTGLIALGALGRRRLTPQS